MTSKRNMSIDMFDESVDDLKQSHFEVSMIELTLAELNLDSSTGLATATGPDDHHLNVNLNRMCGPSVRAFLLRKAMLCDDSKVIDAIMFETAAMCLWTLYKYQPVVFQNKMVTKERTRNILAESDTSSRLLDVCREFIGNNIDRCQVSKLREPRLLRDKLDTTRMLINRCREMPKEWTILQMCKGFNPDHGHSLRYDNYTANRPLHFTLFTFVRSELMDDQPLRLHIHWDDFNIFKVCFEFSEYLNTAVKLSNIKPGLDKTMNDLISDIQLFLGPWLVLFSGKAKNVDTLNFEKQIFQIVDTFCHKSKSKYTVRQRVLISLIARRCDMLDQALLEKAAWHISQDPVQCTELCDFLKIKVVNFLWTQDTKKFAYYPTIVIMDELVDFIYWEMTCPQQELARMSSMALLFKLYDKYAANVKDGYVRVKTGKGFVLCNPDSNLPFSQDRLEPLFKSWYPRYNFMSGKQPSPSVFKDAINKSDVYIYAGHGSGLQFLGGNDIADSDLHCVAFLYGCLSVALKSDGTQCESTGAHLFLQYAMCPAVVGFLNITTDSWTDILTVGMNKMWLPAADPKYKLSESWSALWVHYKRALDAMVEQSAKTSLLEAVATVRCMKELPMRIRCINAYRGLPVSH